MIDFFLKQNFATCEDISTPERNESEYECLQSGRALWSVDDQAWQRNQDGYYLLVRVSALFDTMCTSKMLSCPQFKNERFGRYRYQILQKVVFSNHLCLQISFEMLDDQPRYRAGCYCSLPDDQNAADGRGLPWILVMGRLRWHPI